VALRAQSNLGELLNAGAKRLSVEEFKEEVVQRVIVGPTLTGGSIEVMYASNGQIQGLGSYAALTQAPAPIRGDWAIDDEGRVCTNMRVGPELGALYSAQLPRRCQFWFKHGERYFFSDSDTDRHARVLSRTVKQ
jgi:hypothetical protein